MSIICIYQLCQDHRTEMVPVPPPFVSIVLVADLGFFGNAQAFMDESHSWYSASNGGVYLSCRLEHRRD